MSNFQNDLEAENFAASIAHALYGLSAHVAYRPEKPRKQRYCVYKSESSFGGVHDMVQVAHGDSWKKAAVHAALGYRFQMEEQLRNEQSKNAENK